MTTEEIETVLGSDSTCEFRRTAEGEPGSELWWLWIEGSKGSNAAHEKKYCIFRSPQHMVVSIKEETIMIRAIDRIRPTGA